MQKICTEGKGERIPMKNDIISVNEVIVIETAASLRVAAILSGTGFMMLVRLQAANITNVSSIPIPESRNSAGCNYLFPWIFFDRILPAF